MEAGLVYGCITPHPPILVPAVAGRRVSQVDQTRTAMETIAREVAAHAPDVVLLISPHAPVSAHAMGVCMSDSYSGDFESFGASGARLRAEGDAALAREIGKACKALGVPCTTFGRQGGAYHLDHGAAVPWYYLTQATLRCRLVLLSFSALDVAAHRQFGKAIAAAVQVHGVRAVLVASGDLSHRLIPNAPAGYSPMGMQFDEALVGAIRRGDREAIFRIDEGLRSQAGECGYRSVVIALGAMPEARTDVLSYEGPFGVGYVVARLVPQEQPKDVNAGTSEGAVPRDRTEQQCLEIARSAVEAFVKTGKKISPTERPQGFLAESAGVFVSLKIDGQLRGCIGTFAPTEPYIANEIIRNAIASASRDPRFPPVTSEELPLLEYSIDVLSPTEAVDDESQLDPSRYGVLVQSGSRRGLLLPDLEGVDTVKAQLDIAKRKAGIWPDEAVKISRFTVRRMRQ